MIQIYYKKKRRQNFDLNDNIWIYYFSHFSDYSFYLHITFSMNVYYHNDNDSVDSGHSNDGELLRKHSNRLSDLCQIIKGRRNFAKVSAICFFITFFNFHNVIALKYFKQKIVKYLLTNQPTNQPFRYFNKYQQFTNHSGISAICIFTIRRISWQA